MDLIDKLYTKTEKFCIAQEIINLKNSTSKFKIFGTYKTLKEAELAYSEFIENMPELLKEEKNKTKLNKKLPITILKLEQTEAYKRIDFNGIKEEPKLLITPVSLFDKKEGEYLFVYNLETDTLSIPKIDTLSVAGNFLYLTLESDKEDPILFTRPPGKNIPLIHTKIRVIATSTKEIEDWLLKNYGKTIKL